MKTGVLALLGVTLPVAAAMAEPVPRAQVEAALAPLSALAESVIAAGGVPGLSIAIVHEDEVVFAQGWGLRRMGGQEAVDADTVFQLASLSKPISATVVAALVSGKLVNWDAKLTDLAPDYQLHEPYVTAEVTVKDFFSHRSGLPGSAGNDLEDMGFDRDTIMSRLALVEPASSLRSAYAYSNAGLTMGALAAVRPGGMGWEEAAQAKLFGPLGMTTASYSYADFTSRENATSLHVQGPGGWEPRVTRDATPQAPAGGASASARDLAQWVRLVLANGMWEGAPLIEADALKATHTPMIATGTNPVTGAQQFYGLGWSISWMRHGLEWGHAGAFSRGAQTLVKLWPESGLGIIVLTNAFPSGTPEGLADSFADLAFDGAVARDYIAPWTAAYTGLFAGAEAAARAEYGTRPADATPPLPATAYSGRYANAYFGEVEVTAEGEALTLVLGPGGVTRLPLTPFNRDLFLARPEPEAPDLTAALTFRIGPDGRADGFLAAFLDDNGFGQFDRVE